MAQAKAIALGGVAKLLAQIGRWRRDTTVGPEFLSSPNYVPFDAFLGVQPALLACAGAMRALIMYC